MPIIKTRTDEIEKKIKSHISTVIEMVKEIGAQAIRDLRHTEREEINKIDNFKDNIDKELSKLLHINDMISANLGAKPNISFFKPIPRVTIWRKFINYRLNTFINLMSLTPEELIS